jgi:hypothetical protein
MVSSSDIVQANSSTDRATMQASRSDRVFAIGLGESRILQ